MDIELKEKISKLDQHGFSTKEIMEATSCSRESVLYVTSKEYRAKNLSDKCRRVKEGMIELKKMAGGKCSVCGYDRSLYALDFHHLDPDKKDNGVCYLLRTKSFKAAAEESKKCALLCSNCHRELHDGLITLKNRVKYSKG
jgi:5-methylcytosine-specific restriction endonuclease McrA